jgi:hypothetical protein
MSAQRLLPTATVTILPCRRGADMPQAADNRDRTLDQIGIADTADEILSDPDILRARWHDRELKLGANSLRLRPKILRIINRSDVA